MLFCLYIFLGFLVYASLIRLEKDLDDSTEIAVIATFLWPLVLLIIVLGLLGKTLMFLAKKVNGIEIE